MIIKLTHMHYHGNTAFTPEICFNLVIFYQFNPSMKNLQHLGGNRSDATETGNLIQLKVLSTVL